MSSRDLEKARRLTEMPHFGTYDAIRTLRLILDHLEEEQRSATVSQETPSLSPDTAQPEATPLGSSTSFETLPRVKVEIPGAEPITATVMFLDCNSTLTAGLVQRFLRDGVWTVETPSTLESPSRSGVVPSRTQVVREAGSTAGGLEQCLEAHRHCSGCLCRLPKGHAGVHEHSHLGLGTRYRVPGPTAGGEG